MCIFVLVVEEQNTYRWYAGCKCVSIITVNRTVKTFNTNQSTYQSLDPWCLAKNLRRKKCPVCFVPPMCSLGFKGEICFEVSGAMSTTIILKREFTLLYFPFYVFPRS